MRNNHSFLTRLGIELPIIQAPMAGVATPELAAAVSNAGALGSLGAAAWNVEQTREKIRQTRTLTSRPFNVNVFCHVTAQRNAEQEAAWIAHLTPLFTEIGATPPDALESGYKTFVGDDEMLEMLIDERPAVVSFHFGLPSDGFIAALKGAGITLLATATNLAEAQAIAEAGLDAVIAQGIEAGGHRGMFDPEAPDEQLSTAVLVRLLAQRTQLPVIAAGGIMDGRGIRAALDLGATAAQLGTAFVTCPESAANAAYRKALKSERAHHTRLTTAISGRPARGMLNRLITHGDAPGSPPAAAYPLAYHAAKQLNAAASKQGNYDFAAQWAGQGAPLARELPAAELVNTLAKECCDAM